MTQDRRPVAEVDWHGHRATLYDDGLWESANEDVKGVLNALYDPNDDRSPADGAFGRMTVHKLQKETGATLVQFFEMEQTPSGVVY